MATLTERPLKRKSRYFLVASCLALVVTFVGFFKTFILPIRSRHLQRACRDLCPRRTIIPMDCISRYAVHAHPDEETVFASAAGLCQPWLGALRGDFHHGGGRLCIEKRPRAWRGAGRNFEPDRGIHWPMMFAILVAAAIVYRRRPEFHKRLMLLAMIAIIWPAFFRFRHYFPQSLIPKLFLG